MLKSSVLLIIRGALKAIPINAMMFIEQGYDLRATSSAAEASMPPSCGSS
jgi:hypothetical protein